MSTDIPARHSRRALLAAAAGAAAASVVSAIDHPAAVRAGTDGDVVLGAPNTATTTTAITIDANDADVLAVRGSGGSTALAGINDDWGIGARGDSRSGAGVLGVSPAGHGIEGSSRTGTGVLGVSESGAGVLGESSLGGYGVRGHSLSPGGVGVYASAEAGTALQVTGKARFSRSGRAQVAAGKSSVDVDLTAKGGLSGTPLCYANLMDYRPGTFVIAVRPNHPAASSIRIYLNRAVTSATDVAWLVLR